MNHVACERQQDDGRVAPQFHILMFILHNLHFSPILQCLLAIRTEHGFSRFLSPAGTDIVFIRHLWFTSGFHSGEVIHHGIFHQFPQVFWHFLQDAAPFVAIRRRHHLVEPVEGAVNIHSADS